MKAFGCRKGSRLVSLVRLLAIPSFILVALLVRMHRANVDNQQPWSPNTDALGKEDFEQGGGGVGGFAAGGHFAGGGVIGSIITTIEISDKHFRHLGSRGGRRTHS